MHAFAVLIFWFLLGGRKLKSELLEILCTFPHISRLAIYKQKRGQYHFSKRNSVTSTALISVSMHGMRRSTLTLQESLNDLVHELSPNHTIKIRQMLLE